MIYKNKTIKYILNFLIILLLVPSILFLKSNQSEAYVIPVIDPTNIAVNTATAHTSALSQILLGTNTGAAWTNTGLHIKDFAKEILRQIIMTVERRLLQEMTKSTVNWINSGFHGSPLFLQNPTAFFQDIEKYEIKTLIGAIGYDPVRFPYGESFALNIINSYKRKLDDNAAYSFSNATRDPVFLNNMQNNFNFGGWNGFLINTQYPQNNYIGYNMLVTQKLAEKLEGKVTNNIQKVQNTLQQGLGFLSPQTCPSNTKYNNGVNEFQKPVYQPISFNPPPQLFETIDGPDKEEDGTPIKITVETQDSIDQRTVYAKKWQEEDLAVQNKWSETNTCPKGLVATTPGSVVGSQITGALGSTFRESELGSALGNSVGAILDAFLSHFLDKGLNSLASTINPPAPTDNWSYNGQTLTNDTLDTNTPQTVSVNIGGVINLPLSSGLAPYFIDSQPNTTLVNAQILNSGDILMIQGLKTGTTSLTIKDSSSTPQTFTVNIIVNNNTNTFIDFNQTAIQNISTNINQIDTNSSLANVAINNGVIPYTIINNPDSNILIAHVSDNILTLSGVAPGQTQIILKDSSTPNKTITINVTVNDINNTSLTSDTENVTADVNVTTNIKISGGTQPYNISTQPDDSIVLSSLADDKLTLIGLKGGNTSIKIQDSSFPVQTITIPINIKELVSENTNTDVLGSCTDVHGTRNNITQQDCGMAQWTPNPTNTGLVQ